MAKPKVAVVLFNLGGPDRPESVEPFLFNLFNDPAIIRLPNPFRYFLARLISAKRAPVAQEIYHHLGGGSPIVPQTKKQAAALQEILKKDWDCRTFVCMRYWHPMSDIIAEEVKDFAPDHIIALPLYPQFSTTTTGSSFKEWKRAVKKVEMDIPTSEICCYPLEEQFIKAHLELLLPIYAQAEKLGKPRILFSAHGLPENIIKGGDSYQWQVEQTTIALVEKIGISFLDYVNCYQSRVGRLKWIGPSTEEEIIRAGKDNVPLVIVPISFVSEHSETLVELDIEYKALAEKHGVEHYFRVPALGEQPSFIQCLANLCREAYGKVGIHPGDHEKRFCPPDFKGCICRNS